MKTSLIASSYHSVMISDIGSLYAWGYNHRGQVGIGTQNSPISTPTQIDLFVESNESLISVVCGRYHTAVLTSSGRVFTWGDNQYGQLGIGTFDMVLSPTPMLVQNLENIVSIDAGDYHMIAMNSEGILFSWGRNSSGELGINDYENRYSPVRITSLVDIKFFVCGCYHSVAVSEDGSFYSWGNNEMGQIGVGSTEYENFSSPQIVKLENVRSVACGYHYTVALTFDDVLFGWGRNVKGQLGIGHFGNVYSPTLIPIEDVYFVACSNNETLAIKRNGKLYIWGLNDLGQLGLGHKNNMDTPQILDELDNVIFATCGGQHSFALLEDLTLYSWGRNSESQLGLRLTTNRDTPKLVHLPMNLSTPRLYDDLNIFEVFLKAGFNTEFNFIVNLQTSTGNVAFHRDIVAIRCNNLLSNLDIFIRRNRPEEDAVILMNYVYLEHLNSKQRLDCLLYSIELCEILDIPIFESLLIARVLHVLTPENINFFVSVVKKLDLVSKFQHCLEATKYPEIFQTEDPDIMPFLNLNDSNKEKDEMTVESTYHHDIAIFISEEFTDLKLILQGGEEVNINQSILCLYSDYFEKLIIYEIKEKSCYHLDFEFCSPDSFNYLIDFMYSLKIEYEINHIMAFEILWLIDFILLKRNVVYLFKPLIQKCKKTLLLSIHDEELLSYLRNLVGIEKLGLYEKYLPEEIVNYFENEQKIYMTVQSHPYFQIINENFVQSEFRVKELEKKIESMEIKHTNQLNEMQSKLDVIMRLLDNKM